MVFVYKNIVARKQNIVMARWRDAHDVCIREQIVFIVMLQKDFHYAFVHFHVEHSVKRRFSEVFVLIEGGMQINSPKVKEWTINMHSKLIVVVVFVLLLKMQQYFQINTLHISSVCTQFQLLNACILLAAISRSFD